MSNLSGKDVVIHLAGEPISKPLGGMVPLPWTSWKRKEILESRVNGTKLIAEHIASLNNPPKVLICASAVGYYGDRGEDYLAKMKKMEMIFFHMSLVNGKKQPNQLLTLAFAWFF